MISYRQLINRLLEDIGTSDLTHKKWIDRFGQTRTRTYPAHRVDFSASKKNSEPSQEDAPLK